MGDFIVVAIVLSAIALIIYKGVQNKKNGNACSGCHLSKKQNCCSSKDEGCR